ncbi:NAD(P)/FAD-dependent oxidoreductase [Saccharothrix algeriensis]|uniref:FAD-dependent oxidoreductase n=1 Tax=Saccharothrix algeriensis TaxID=173560 RepID=A0A8T8HU44_9PSEU|nr:FAD-dependent oxidoreductase [Saccharothrix algeriensis]MBM7813356.1 NADH dehydrogenase FAD-containing subunit [Saccharothrix algeriensis]QTR01889.1 FAD-dependent oxidoreductase [Saccharothrix algeriensis]
MAERIVVVGAGYAGLAAAKLAARWTGARVTLVNDRDRFVERVRLHQLAAGQPLPDRPLADLLRGSGVHLVVDRVTGVDPLAREVRLTAGALGYDRLVYALGSHADLDSAPGVREHAHAVATEEDAKRLRAALPGSRAVAVVGGGLTGIEAAAELAESHPRLRVELVTDGVLGAALSTRAQRYLRRVFDRLGVRVREHTRVREIDARGFTSADGTRVAADAVVWTAGFRVPDLARAAGLAVDGAGRVLVDQHLTSVSHPEVTALGDAAAIRRPDGLELRMACATGIPTAQRAVRALADRMRGLEPGPFRFSYLNQCVSLGRRHGLIQFVRGDDTPRDAVLTGRLAARYKEAVVRGALLVQRHPTLPTG